VFSKKSVKIGLHKYIYSTVYMSQVAGGGVPGTLQLGLTQNHYLREKDSQKRTARKGQTEQDRQNRTGRTGQAEQDRQNRTGKAAQAKWDRQT
jgi:hypothetical protein